MNEPLRVLIADDHPLFRDGVVNSLVEDPDIEIVGTASSGEEAIRMACDLLPDAMLLDITMEGMSGIQAAKAIATQCPATNIIMLTVSEHEDDLMAAFKAGARGYVLKGISGRELAKVVKTVVRGEVYVSPGLASAMLLEMSTPSPPDPLDELTQREIEILELVSDGLTNQEIGDNLHLAEKTIKHYMSNILQKLHVRSRVQAALIAQRQKFDGQQKR